MFDIDKHLYVFSPYSGLLFFVNKTEFNFLDDGVIPLKEKPKRCKKCYDRFFTGYDPMQCIYQPCRCLSKFVDFDLLPNKLEITND